jgi:ribosomal-protein-alanine N-acetyltransferase
MLLTERLQLEPVGPDTVDTWLAVLRDTHVRRYLLDGAVVERAWVLAEASASAERFASGSVGIFLAMPRGYSAVVGFAGFRPFDELELLYGILPAYAGRGFAIEAARAALDFAFSTAAMQLVRASVDAPNVASVRLLERLGMTRVGDGERLRFQLRREDWRG